MFKSIITPAIAGIAILAAPASALASETQNNSVRVHVGDLDLATEAGAAEMKKRVRAGAFKACLFDEEGQLVTVQEQNACARIALQKSETQMAQKIANSRYGG